MSFNQKQPQQSKPQEHYRCKISNMSSDESKITPTWTKVSTTPWSGKAAHYSGYGRRVMGCTISDDMPLNFVRTEFVPRPEPLSVSKSKRNQNQGSSSDAAYVLPGGHNQKTPVHGTRYVTLKYEKQIILEPLVTERVPNNNSNNEKL